MSASLIDFDMSINTADMPKPSKPLMDKNTALSLYDKFHYADRAAPKGMTYYVPHYVKLHQTQRWCGHPDCPRPVKKEDAKCPLCGTLFCSESHLVQVHGGKTGSEVNSHCGKVNQTSAVRTWFLNVFTNFNSEKLPGDEEPRVIFKEYKLIQQLEFWLMKTIFSGRSYSTLSTLNRNDFIKAVETVPLHTTVDGMGSIVRVHGFGAAGLEQRKHQTSKTTVIKCEEENVFQDMAGLLVFLSLGLDFLTNHRSRAQMLMSAAALVHASGHDSAFVTESYTAISLTDDGIRPAFVTGEKLASPFNIYKTDQLVQWPACYYVIMLVPVGIVDPVQRRAMMFSVGVYATAKDSMVFASAGMSDQEGFGFISFVAHAQDTLVNPWINRSALGSKQHLSVNDTERWFKRISELTALDVKDDPENGSTSTGREAIIRDRLGISDKLKFPLPFPRYRLVTARLVMHIV